jgi:hypothetical protein
MDPCIGEVASKIGFNNSPLREKISKIMSSSRREERKT